MKHTYQIQKGIQIAITLFLIFCFSLANAQKSKGKLFIIGGGNRSDQLMQQLVDISQFKKTDYIVVLPMSSEEPDSAYIYFKDQLKRLTPNPIIMLNFDKTTVQNPKLNDITQIQFDNGLLKPSAKLIRYTDLEKIQIWNDSIAKARMVYFLKLQEDWKKRSQYKTLQEVIIKSRAKPKEDALDERYASGLFAGGDAQVLDFMSDPASMGGLDLFTYLQGRVPGLMVNRSGSAVSLTWRGANPDIYLDQQLVGPEFIQSMNVRDVAIIKVFRPPFFGSIGGGSGGAIAIYSKKGGDMRTANDGRNSKGMLSTLIPGYTRFKEFFNPQYDVPGDNPDTDIRNTLYWSPYIITNKKHPRFKIQFFNNDFSKKLNIVLEGVNTNGKITRVVKVIE